MKHELFTTLPFTLERAAPRFSSDEDKYPESIVRYFLKLYTKKGCKVFDPFAGLGTTMFVCEETGRIPYGIEHDTDRYEWVAGQMENWSHMVNGDAAAMGKYGFPKLDFCITSPPYMPRHHKWNPLYGGDPKKAGYDLYLKRMGYIFKQLSTVLKRNGYAVVQADNLQHGKIYTPLVRDLSLAIEKSMRLEAEIIVKWKPAKPDYPHTHCLVFKNVK